MALCVKSRRQTKDVFCRVTALGRGLPFRLVRGVHSVGLRGRRLLFLILRELLRRRRSQDAHGRVAVAYDLGFGDEAHRHSQLLHHLLQSRFLREEGRTYTITDFLVVFLFFLNQNYCGCEVCDHQVFYLSSFVGL